MQGNDEAIFNNTEDLLDTIDEIELGDLPWTSFTMKYVGPLDENSPSWKRKSYMVHTRNPLMVVENFLKNQDFATSIDYSPFEEYVDGKRIWSNLLSGNWAWKEAVSTYSLLIV